MDPPGVPHVPGNAVRLQFHALAYNLQLHADAGAAEDGGAVVLTSLREKLIKNRRESRQSRALRHVPDGRGRGTATDVGRHPVADRPAARTARTGMSGAAGDA